LCRRQARRSDRIFRRRPCSVRLPDRHWSCGSVLAHTSAVATVHHDCCSARTLSSG
jgi:hypothetical protein